MSTTFPNPTFASVTLAQDATSDQHVVTRRWVAEEIARQIAESEANTNARFADYMPIAGVTDGSNAAPGDVGEFLSATVTTVNAVPLNSGAQTPIMSLDLPAGDWDVMGLATYSGTSNAINLLAAWLSTAVGGVIEPNAGGYGVLYLTGGPTFLTPLNTLALSRQRNNFDAPATIYMITQTQFGGGTLLGSGFISARRAR